MKTLVLTALAATSLGLTAMQAKAGHCHYVSIGVEVPDYVSVRYTAPYIVNTTEVSRSTYWKVAYDSYGNPYRYAVTVVTYANYYNNGTVQTFTRTFRG